MEGIINNLRSLFMTYGFAAFTIIVLTVIITNLIKKPIINYGLKIAENTGYDKSIITKNICYIPFGVSLILTIIYNIFAVGFNFANLDWGNIASSSVVYASAAIATYEVIKKQLEAYASKKVKKEEL